MTETGTAPEDRSENQDAAIDGEQLSTATGDPSPDDLAAIEAEEAEQDGRAEQSELEELRAEAARHFDNYQRAVADLANYRRRKEQEVLRVGEQARRELLKQFLPVVDDFERAVQAADTESAERVIEGFKLIERKLWSVLEQVGVRRMESLGQPFDPRLHEAVQVEEGVSNPDTVIEEYARGYLIGDEVLRPAMVKVGAGDDEARSQAASNSPSTE